MSYLFVLYFTTLFQQLSLYSVEWNGDKWMMNWIGFGRSGGGLIVRRYPRISLEGLSKTTKLCLSGPRFEPRPPEYETGMLTTRKRRSVATTFRPSGAYGFYAAGAGGQKTDVSFWCRRKEYVEFYLYAPISFNEVVVRVTLLNVRSYLSAFFRHNHVRFVQSTVVSLHPKLSFAICLCF
jgi:alpha-beta hydrolase superfamily lysophospholipase